MTGHRCSIVLLACALTACAQPPAPSPPAQPATVRICDDTGCSDRPRAGGSFDPSAGTDPEEAHRIAALTELANKDPRAAYDLGLRYFRGDGVRQNSYQAIQWMRSAGERGDLQAQSALGRFYLMGLEEMGSDPAEAEKWLMIAAGRGDREARVLQAEASAAKLRSQYAYRAWVDARRAGWYGYWYSGYPYYWAWGGPRGWYYRY
ncbi:tetratricopeptide repeat protein [Variovorax sp. PvP013]|uniref:tetratricopeptide repeat protein n=1 Tax=Variovorax sp. PvP013 TaxID=3156435 RepID=UPI003D202F96